MVYKKNSFINLTGETNTSIKSILNKIKNLNISKSNLFNEKQKKIFTKIKEEMHFKNNKEFNLTNNIIDELNITDLDDWPKYLVHRYRYEVYPDKKILDEYPPYLQIEPSSICNYRCVFCFETDKSFN